MPAGGARGDLQRPGVPGTDRLPGGSCHRQHEAAALGDILVVVLVYGRQGNFGFRNFLITLLHFYQLIKLQ